MSNQIRLTDGDDDYTVEADRRDWFDLFALEGNDRIVLRSSGNVLGGPGNDTIINETGQPWGGAVYWDSPGPILVDLQKGTAQDGWGTTDTLVNIHGVNTAGRDGDVVLGSDTSDYVWVNGFWQPGRATIDLRGGADEATLGGPISDYVLKVSTDGRQVEITKNNYTAVLSNVERLQFWNFDNSGQNFVTSVIDLIDLGTLGPQVLLSPGQNGWHEAQRGTGLALTYSFMTAPPVYGGQEGGTGFVAPTPAYQQAVRDILQRLQAETGLRFTEVADTASSYGQLRFGANQQTGTKGYAFMPGTQNERAGDVWMDLESLQRLAEGQEGRQALLHEIGHALGLSHPIDEGSASGSVLLDRWNNNSYTLMSSRQMFPDMWQSWFGAFDMQALVELYGPPTATGVQQDDFIRLSDASGLSLWSLHDTGGSDTVDGSLLSVGMTLDLRPGGFSSVGLNAAGTASWNNLFTDYSTLIERVYDTPDDDVIWGNSQDNYFQWNAGNDVIDGQGGQDTLIINHPRSQFSVSVSDYTGLFQISDNTGVLGSVTASSVERVWFRDVQLNLGVTAPDAIEQVPLDSASALVWDRTGPNLEQVGTPAAYQRIVPGQALKLRLNENLVLGDGTVQLTHLGTGERQLFSKALNNLSLSGNTLTVGKADDLDINTTYRLEFIGNVASDVSGNPMLPTPASTFRVGNPDSLYQFFIVAFAAPAGGYYMDQLAQAYNHFQNVLPIGDVVPTIVNIFTTKSQFTSVYPTSLSHKALATQLVANIVKDSASEIARASAVKDIETTLGMGWSVGKILYTVFGNLANKPASDPYWAGTAKQFANQVAVAKYLTEAMDYRNDKLADLQHILAGVTPTTDVSSPEKMASLIGVALESLHA